MPGIIAAQDIEPFRIQGLVAVKCTADQVFDSPANEIFHLLLAFGREAEVSKHNISGYAQILPGVDECPIEIVNKGNDCFFLHALTTMYGLWAIGYNLW
jgi:hypothetical protein